MNYLVNKTFHVRGGRTYNEGTVISGVEYDTLDEEHQGNFEETKMIDVGETDEQIEAREELFEKAQEIRKKNREEWQEAKEKRDEEIRSHLPERD